MQTTKATKIVLEPKEEVIIVTRDDQHGPSVRITGSRVEGEPDGLTISITDDATIHGLDSENVSLSDLEGGEIGVKSTRFIIDI